MGANEHKRPLRDDPTGPEIGAFLEHTLGTLTIDRDRLEDEAVRQMDLSRNAGTEYINALDAHASAEAEHENLLATLCEAERGTGERMTETALKQRIARDPRMAAVAKTLQNAATRLEAARLALKFYWERGEMIRALLFSRNTEMRALGAPASGGGTSSALVAPAAGELTRRASAKYGNKKG